MLTKSLKLICTLAMAGVIGACNGASPMGPEEPTETSPDARTACLAGGEVAVRAGCPGTSDTEEGGYDGEFEPVGEASDTCPGSWRVRNKGIPC